MKAEIQSALTECADEMVANANAQQVTIFTGETTVNNEPLYAYVTLSRSKLRTGTVEPPKKDVDPDDEPE